MRTAHKPGMDLLLSVLRGDPLPASPDWPQALALAEAESILPWLLHRAPSLEAPAARRQVQINAFFFTAQLTSLLKSFAEAGIPVLLLKGPSFAERVYGAPAHRAARDLDLLVRPYHFAPAQALLHTLGFTPDSHPDDYHQALSRNTLTVELHYDVDNPLTFDFRTAQAWQRAIPTTFHGQPAYIFAPPDELLYLCLHGTRHRFSRLSYLLDIALAIQHFGAFPPIHPNNSLANIQTLGLALANKLLPASLPPASPHAESLAESLWQQVLTTPESPTDWQTNQRFYLQLERTTLGRLTRRLRQLLILTTRITQPDRDFAINLGLPYNWAAYLFRPIRLLTGRSPKP